MKIFIFSSALRIFSLYYLCVLYLFHGFLKIFSAWVLRLLQFLFSGHIALNPPPPLFSLTIFSGLGVLMNFMTNKMVSNNFGVNIGGVDFKVFVTCLYFRGQPSKEAIFLHWQNDRVLQFYCVLFTIQYLAMTLSCSSNNYFVLLLRASLLLYCWVNYGYN